MGEVQVPLPMNRIDFRTSLSTSLFLVCGDFDKILMEAGKFSDNIRFIENGLLFGVDSVFKF